jgi:SAM-dependent methyltransferase
VDPVRKFFDEIGDGEWGRFDKDARSRVAFEFHRRFLRRHVADGAHVLEIGAGPGRFTIELARMGCRVVVSDISPVQLEANERRVNTAGWEEAVLERRVVDVRDLREFSDGAFDDAEAALAEMVRVVRPGGSVVASVMELVGTCACSDRVDGSTPALHHSWRVCVELPLLRRYRHHRLHRARPCAMAAPPRLGGGVLRGAGRRRQRHASAVRATARVDLTGAFDSRRGFRRRTRLLAVFRNGSDHNE